jgi:hypothetical protein
MGTSQLGGVVYGNTNLNQNADIILNEVGSTDRSVFKPSLSTIKLEVRSLLILNLVITPSLISERPLTIVSFESTLQTPTLLGFLLITTKSLMLVNKGQYSIIQKSWAHHNSVVWYTATLILIKMRILS